MIIRINLLSTDRIRKEERTDILALGYVVVGVVFIVLLVTYMFQLQSLSRIEQRIQRAQAELTKYQAIVAQVDALQATKKVLETKKSVIDSLLSSGLLYPKYMETLARITPSGIGFRTMNTAVRGDGALDVSLDADAIDNYAIADFIGALCSDPSFSAVEMGAVSSSNGAKVSGAAFHLTFTYARKKG